MVPGFEKAFGSFSSLDNNLDPSGASTNVYFTSDETQSTSQRKTTLSCCPNDSPGEGTDNPPPCPWNGWIPPDWGTKPGVTVSGGIDNGLWFNFHAGICITRWEIADFGRRLSKLCLMDSAGKCPLDFLNPKKWGIFNCPLDKGGCNMDWTCRGDCPFDCWSDCNSDCFSDCPFDCLFDRKGSCWFDKKGKRRCRLDFW